MKVVLFRDGHRGSRVILPGEDPMVELSDLLGGAIEMKPITRRLALVTLEDAEELQLPMRYMLKRMGMVDKRLRGDCAIVARLADGRVTDVDAHDIVEAVNRVQPAVMGAAV